MLGTHHLVLIKGKAHTLAATICIADDIAHEVGYGVIPKAGDAVSAMTELERDCVSSHTSSDRSSPKTLEHARGVLEIGDSEMAQVRGDVEALKGSFTA